MRARAFVDAALRNITVFNAAGDGGSGNQSGNGLTNVGTSRASPYAFMVGGTAYSTVQSALADETLTDVVSQAMAHDRATIWQLMTNGLTEMPNPSNLTAMLIEAVWNEYYVTGTTIASKSNQTGYRTTTPGSGGVDPKRPRPGTRRRSALIPGVGSFGAARAWRTGVAAEAVATCTTVPGPAMRLGAPKRDQCGDAPCGASPRRSKHLHDRAAQPGYANELF